jgi:phosphate transport system substrate-binding protein
MTGRDRTIIGRRACTLALTAGIYLCSYAAARSSDVNVAETGSTLIHPLFKAWIAEYAKIDPVLHLSAGATGSGEGIAQTISKQVQIGTWDAYMTDNQAMANPHILNIPLAISAQTVQVNFPNFRAGTLKLNGPVLAGIYSGKIHEWGEPPIAEMNQGTRFHARKPGWEVPATEYRHYHRGGRCPYATHAAR